MSSASITVATYNVHRCVGRDGRCAPDRIDEVLRELRADVIGLQEVDCHVATSGGFDQLSHFAGQHGFQAVAGPIVRRMAVTTGNGLLSRHPVIARRWIDLSVAHREPRGALDVDLEIDGTVVRVVNAHLGLRTRERREQIDRLIHALSGETQGPSVVIGDFNEWLPRGRGAQRLHMHFGATPAPRTFPSRRPLFALDRVFVKPRAVLTSVQVLATEAARCASDHLPVRAVLELAAGHAW